MEKEQPEQNDVEFLTQLAEIEATMTPGEWEAVVDFNNSEFNIQIPAAHPRSIERARERSEIEGNEVAPTINNVMFTTCYDLPEDANNIAGIIALRNGFKRLHSLAVEGQQRKRQIEAALEAAGRRWSEWGDRAMSVFNILDNTEADDCSSGCPQYRPSDDSCDGNCPDSSWRKRATIENVVNCTCYCECGEDAESGSFHQHEDELCQVHPLAIVARDPLPSPPSSAPVLPEAAPQPNKETTMTFSDEQIKYVVSRFLGWRLPENFNPDAGISFKREFNEHTAHPMKHEPTGTNLFDATQTEAMIRYLVEGIPDV